MSGRSAGYHMRRTARPLLRLAVSLRLTDGLQQLPALPDQEGPCRLLLSLQDANNSLASWMTAAGRRAGALKYAMPALRNRGRQVEVESGSWA